MAKALRYNDGKPKMAYILKFPKAMEAVARVKEFGAAKYFEDNWKQGKKPDSEYLNSAMRHLFAREAGEIYDQDSGCSHIGHAIWNLLAFIELNHPEETCDPVVFNERCAFWDSKKVNDEQSDSILP